MRDFMCPNCGETCDVEMEDIPERACDDTEYECENCGQEMRIGWYAEIEVRSMTVPYGDLDK